MSYDQLVASLPAHEQQRLQQATGAQRDVLRMYAALHAELRLQISKILASRANAPAQLTASQYNQILRLIETRVKQLNAALAVALAKRAAPINDLVVKQVRRELRAAGIPKSFRPTLDPNLIERHLTTAVQNIVGWNGDIGHGFLSAVQAGVAKGESYRDILKRVNSLDGYKGETHPVKRARTHAMLNIRYSVVYASNAARLDAYQQASSFTGEAMQKMWIAAPRCCHNCALLHGQTVFLDDDFPWQALGLTLVPYKGVLSHPPLHPQCRCRLVPLLAGHVLQVMPIERVLA